MSILKRWYSGDLYPDEQAVPRDTAYHSIIRKIVEERDYFEAKLSLEDRDRFEKLSGLLLESSSMDCYANFSYGFKMGAMLMCEVFIGEDKPEV